ncbi:hypothetical protein Cus16_2516 [Curtobacterium sp. ER1/6]|nr:hypothetical protein Cus16_2516 [Curtobacterium sp. ER1/6]
MNPVQTFRVTGPSVLADPPAEQPVRTRARAAAPETTARVVRVCFIVVTLLCVAGVRGSVFGVGRCAVVDGERRSSGGG